jgi:hypothetical protein
MAGLLDIEVLEEATSKARNSQYQILSECLLPTSLEQESQEELFDDNY